MEAASHSGIARLVQQSFGTSALFPLYVFVTNKYTCINSICTYIDMRMYMAANILLSAAQAKALLDVGAKAEGTFYFVNGCSIQQRRCVVLVRID
jgi:hypothetical protein